MQQESALNGILSRIWHSNETSIHIGEEEGKALRNAINGSTNMKCSLKTQLEKFPKTLFYQCPSENKMVEIKLEKNKHGENELVFVDIPGPLKEKKP